MSIEINLLQASVTSLYMFFPEHIFSAVGKEFWLFADGVFKCDCGVSIDSHRLKRDMTTHSLTPEKNFPRVRMISRAKNYVWATAHLRVFGFGSDENGDVRVGVFPEVRKSRYATWHLLLWGRNCQFARDIRVASNLLRLCLNSRLLILRTHRSLQRDDAGLSDNLNVVCVGRKGLIFRD